MASHLVLTLSDSDRWRLRPHFKSLAIRDRRLRFGAVLNDAAINRYVDHIDFDLDAVLAVACGEDVPLAVVHVAPVGEGAELGLSVLAPQRGRGMGGALFAAAAALARERGFGRIFMHCLRENRAILALARRNDMRLEFEGTDSTAVLALAEPAGAALRESRAHAAGLPGAPASRRIPGAMPQRLA